MTELQELNRLINAVVEARERANEATVKRVGAFQTWLEANKHLIDSELEAKAVCIEAEATLRNLALETYSVTLEKAVAPGIGIRMMKRLNYEVKDAMFWALEHKLCLKLDTPAFENMVKLASETRPSFVTITEEPQATISPELQKVE